VGRVGGRETGAEAASKALLSVSQLLAAALRIADLTRPREKPGKDGRGGAMTEATWPFSGRVAVARLCELTTSPVNWEAESGSG